MTVKGYSILLFCCRCWSSSILLTPIFRSSFISSLQSTAEKNQKQSDAAQHDSCSSCVSVFSSHSDRKEEPKFIMSDLLDSTWFQVMMMIFTLTSFRGWRSEGGGVSSSSHPCKIKWCCIPVQPPSLGRHLSGNSSFPWVGGWYEAHLWISYHEVSLLSISRIYPSCFQEAPRWEQAASILSSPHAALSEGPFSPKSTENSSESENWNSSNK